MISKVPVVVAQMVRPAGLMVALVVVAMRGLSWRRRNQQESRQNDCPCPHGQGLLRVSTYASNALISFMG